MNWWETLPNETLVETAWERQMNLKGFEGYENRKVKETPKGFEHVSASETKAGQKTLRKLLEQATEAIRGLQEDQVKGATKRGGQHPKERKATLLTVPAETLAILALRLLLDRSYAPLDPSRGTSLQGLVVDVANAVENEQNFRNWVACSKEAAEAYADSKGITKIPRSFAEKLIEESQMVKSSKWKWKKAVKEASDYQWSLEEKHYCGAGIISTLLETFPDHFENRLILSKGKQQNFVRMTETFRKQFDDMEYHAASMQTVKKPMITKPKRWVTVE